jgi:hypothetical protein
MQALEARSLELRARTGKPPLGDIGDLIVASLEWHSRGLAQSADWLS